jgi:uncharacterized protein (TIGR02186 family)
MKALLCALLAVLVCAPGARAQTLSADLSSHVIGITTGFAGADLVLFGSTDKPGDIVVVVRGPPAAMTVRHKEKVLGVWLNGSSATYRDAPSFYRVAATRKLAEIAGPQMLARHEIGLDFVKLQQTETMDAGEAAAFRTALLDNQEKAELYSAEPVRVTFLSAHLFRADMAFPATVPTGNYSVEVYLIVGGELASAQTTPLVVSRVGFSNGVFVVAHRHAVLYGAGALVMAISAGWAASAAFRRI